MNVVGEKLECLEGEKFSQIMSGFEFTSASQIVVLLYDRESTQVSGFAKAFVKTASGTYPGAGLITLNTEGKMVFTIDTTGMLTRSYDIEVRVDVSGVSAPIVKQRANFLTIKESRT
jgi:hypothetical protein